MQRAIEPSFVLPMAPVRRPVGLSLRAWLRTMLVAEVVAVLVPVGVLSARFGFPAVLRAPAAEVLPRFLAAARVVVPSYYLFMVSALLYVPLSALLVQYLSATDRPRVWSRLLTALGTGTALAQALGFSRWLLAVPLLAQHYAATTDATTRQTLALAYDVLNQFAGRTIGEHLGFVLMSGWTLALAAGLRHAGYRRLAGAGIGIGLLLLISTAEQFDPPQLAVFDALNSLANTLWTVWLLALAVVLGRNSR